MARVSENRPVHDFNRISLRGYGDILLEQGDEESLTVEAEEAMLPKIITSVQDGCLILDIEFSWVEHLFSPSKPIRYTVQMKDVNGISISGSGAVRTGSLHTTRLEIDISGSAKIQIADLQAETLATHISGSSDFQIAGKIQQHRLRTSGSASVLAQDLETESTDIQFSGSGKTQVWAEKELSIDISGSGHVSYRGQPAIRQRISGVGHIEQIDR